MTNNLQAFAITFKPSPRANAFTWTRFAVDQATAEADAKRLLEEQYVAAKLISVEPTTIEQG